MWSDIARTLYLIECKSTTATSIPLTMIRTNQIEGLKKANKHNLIAGILANFRNDNNDTFFIKIDNFIQMVENINKKSFNAKDLETAGAVKIDSNKKRTRYRYDIEKFMRELHI